MKKGILLIFLVSLTFIGMAQKLTTTSAVVTFDATTPIDKLPKAENKTVISSLDKTTGGMMFEAAVNNFSFTNPLMQTHFNSKTWLNSATYPKFSFSGKIDKLSAVKFNKNGTYNVKVTGDMTIKDVTKKITVPAKITVQKNTIKASTSFSITLADYGIAGQQQIESGKVAKEVKVTVNAEYK